MDIHAYWNAVFTQDADSMRPFFCPDAVIRWHNTNERFTVSEFLRANCEYPGRWIGKVERIETANSLTITVVRVCSPDRKASFHAVSFIRIQEEKIASIDEYWGDDGPAPGWRLGIGHPIL